MDTHIGMAYDRYSWGSFFFLSFIDFGPGSVVLGLSEPGTAVIRPDSTIVRQ